MWALWLALAIPPAGAALRAPGTKLLRSLPIFEGALAAVFFGFVGALHVPWALLFLRGDSAMRAAASMVLSIACVAFAISPRRIFAVAPLALVVAPPAIGVALGAPLATYGAFVAWRAGAEPRSLVTVPLPRNAFIAIALSHVLALVRRERARLIVAVLLLVAARAVLALEHLGAFLAIPAACVAVAAIGPVLARESARLAWILPRPGVAHLASLAIVLAATIPFCGARAALAAPVLFFRAKTGTRYAFFVLGWCVFSSAIWRLACS
jgi:hypothetical protein